MATFGGEDYLSYDLKRRFGGDSIVSKEDALTMDFRTARPDGLLFHTGTSIRIVCYWGRGIEMKMMEMPRPLLREMSMFHPSLQKMAPIGWERGRKGR